MASVSNNSSSNSSLSNYLTEKSPLLYGGKQEEYLKFAEEAIQGGVSLLREGIKTKKSPTKIFFEALEHFRQARHEIAEKHTPAKAALFGRTRIFRKTPEGFHPMATSLFNPYEKYNKTVMNQLTKIVSKMDHDLKGFTKKTAAVGSKEIGRWVKFEVEILDVNDVQALQEKSPTEKELQKLLQTEKTLAEIQKDFELMQRLKKEFPERYQTMIKMIMISHIHQSFPSPKIIDFQKGTYQGNSAFLKNFYLFATLRIEMNGKLFAFTRYVTWLYTNFREDPVERMKENSIVTLFHQDVFLIDDTLQEIAKVFAEALSWDKNKDSLQELKNKVALFRFMYSHCMPHARGDGAIGDWFELSLYRFHGFTTKYNQKRLPCFETLCSLSFRRYLNNYDKIITVQK